MPSPTIRRASMVTITALALCATAGPARAESTWGVAIYDQDDNFVTSRWPETETILIGSGEDCDLILEALHERHARFAIAGGVVTAIPIEGTVSVAGETTSSQISFDPNSAVAVGPYRVQFFLPQSEGETEAVGVDDLPRLSPTTAGTTAVAARAEEFGKQAYRFCHDPEYGEDGVVGADFCVILDEASVEVCPRAAECKDWKPLPPQRRFGRVADGSSSGRSFRRLARRKPLFELPQLPAGVGWVIIALLAGAVVFLFIRTLRRAGWEQDELDFADAEISDAARKLQALPEARSQVLLRMAERSLEDRGDAHEAAILVHLAILRHLDDEGLARYHPSKTNGDYLRSVRRYGPLADLFKRVVLETERIRFGDGTVDPEAVRQAIADARTRLPEHRGRDKVKMPAAPLSVLLLIAASASACGEAPGTQAYYDHGPAGLSAFAPLLREAGMQVDVMRDRLIDLPEDTSVIVLRTSAVGAKPWPKELHLDAQLDQGRSVVVIDDLGKSSFFLPSTASVSAGKIPKAVDIELRVDPAEVSCAYPLSGLAEDFAAEPIRLPEGRLVLWDGISQTSTISGFPLVMRPFLRDATRREVRGRTAAYGWAVHRVTGDEDLPGCLFVFADRDLFTNASLTRAVNARFVGSFFAALTPAGGKVVFADRLDQWTTSESDNPFDRQGDEANPTKALRASNMLPFLLQGLATLALLYIFVGAAFGPLRDVETQKHKNFVEHVEAIGQQYARTGQPGLTHSATSLARLVVMRNRDKLRGGEGGGWAALSRELAEKHDLPEEDVRAALRLGIEGKSEIGSPSPNDPMPSSPRMLETLTRLLGSTERGRKK